LAGSPETGFASIQIARWPALALERWRERNFTDVAKIACTGIVCRRLRQFG
jgi:hypothetical protein